MGTTRSRYDFATDSFDKIVNMANILYAYKRSIRGKLSSKEKTYRISTFQAYELDKMLTRLQTQSYKFSTYHRFHLRDTKERRIYAPKFEDKVVQVAICNILVPYLTQLCIQDTYACLPGRGTSRAIQRIWDYQQMANRDYGHNARFLKLDVSKFFYSIDRTILMEQLKKDILCPKTYQLIYDCVMSFDLEPTGIPLGNVISQHLANYYLNGLDNYIKRILGVKYYVRYADDMFLFVNGDNEAKRVMNACILYADQQLHLTINPVKSYIEKLGNVSGLGHKIFLTHIGVLSRAVTRLRQFIREGKINSLNSWYGVHKIADVHGLIERETRYTSIYFDGRRFWHRKRLNINNYKELLAWNQLLMIPDKLADQGVLRSFRTSPI